LCFHDLALLPGEKPPDPTVPVPKEASDNEVQNSVNITVPSMTLIEVTALKRKILSFSGYGDGLSRKLFDSCNCKGFLRPSIWEYLGVTAFQINYFINTNCGPGKCGTPCRGRNVLLRLTCPWPIV